MGVSTPPTSAPNPLIIIYHKLSRFVIHSDTTAILDRILGGTFGGDYGVIFGGFYGAIFGCDYGSIFGIGYAYSAIFG